MNKDDIWVTRVPVPVRGSVTEPVRDDFNRGALEDLPWNLYSPRWAPITFANLPSATNRSFELRDREPADYARAPCAFFPKRKQRPCASTSWRSNTTTAGSFGDHREMNSAWSED